MCTAILALLALLAGVYRLRKRIAPGCPFRFFWSNPEVPVQSRSLGTGWQERFLDGSAEAEARFIQKAMDEIRVVQANNKQASSAAEFKRAFHAKIQAGIENAQFRVLDSIPSELAVGFLKPGKSYRCALRFSNAAGSVKSDRSKDLRGLALRINTPSGEAHDLLATNGSASHARDARQFIAFARASSGSKLLLLPRLIWRVGFLETLRMFRTVISQVSRRITSLSTETYFSRSAYAFGDCAVRFQFAPAGSVPVAVADRDDYLRVDLVERLKRGPLVFNFQVQLFADESKTPIEDGSREWTTPLVTIAQLVIPQQDLDSKEAAESQRTVEDFEFNPWNVSEGFRPLGSLNRARRLVYKASVCRRKGLSC